MSFLKVGDVAAELNVSEQAVRLWCRTGVLAARRPSGTRQWLIDPDDFHRWLDSPAVRETVDYVRFSEQHGAPDDLLDAKVNAEGERPTH